MKKVKHNVCLLHFFLEDEKEKERKWRIVYTAWRKGTRIVTVEWSTGAIEEGRAASKSPH